MEATVALRGVLCEIVALSILAGCRTLPDPPLAPGDVVAARMQLVSELRFEGITDARVLSAIERVPRHEFVRPEDRTRAYDNRALPIGGGQTISQPYVVARMTELLDLPDHARVLEIGTGSGYQAAVLSLLAQAVYSIEIDPQLADTARERLQRLGYDNVQVRAGDGFYGWPETAPFDAILVTAAAAKVPDRLVAQLRPEGMLVMPLGESGRQTLTRIRKRAGALELEHFDDVAFVPMTGAIRRPTP